MAVAFVTVKMGIPASANKPVMAKKGAVNEVERRYTVVCPFRHFHAEASSAFLQLLVGVVSHTPVTLICDVDSMMQVALVCACLLDVFEACFRGVHH